MIHSLQAGGMERVMSELINYFATSKRYDVHLVLYGMKRDVFYDISKDIIVHTPPFEFNNSSRFFSTIRTNFFLRRTIKRINPIAALSFGERWNNMVLLALFWIKVPIYVSDRAQPNKSLGKLHDTLRRLLYPNATGVIAQTEKASDIYRRMYAHKNIKVIGNPIRQIRAQDIHRENYILMVGRYIKSKQQDVLIEIFSKLNAPDWKLVLVGYDHLKQSNQAEWEVLAKKLHVANRVVFAGKQENVERYYLTSKIFAFTSASEGFPNVIGEAMSAGLPVVSFDCTAGPSDLVVNEANGFLIPPGDKNLFIEKLQVLVDDDELRKEMSIKSKQLIKKFDLNYVCEEYENFLVSNKVS